MKSINKISLILLTISIIWGCEDNLLDTNIEPINNNLPALSSLNSVDGLTTFSRSMYDFLATDDVFQDIGNENESPMLWFTYGYHETMGDVMTMPWGNFGGRWVNQAASVTLDDGSVVNPPEGGPQPGEIAKRNDRAAGSDNAIQYEWRDMYSLIVQGNTVIRALQDLSATDAEKQAFNAWATWWKAYAYHRLGSLYEQGVINENNIIDNPNPVTSNTFVANTQLIEKSNSLLDELSTIIGSISDDDAFNSRLSNLQLAYLRSDAVITKNNLIENINTLRARNLIYNTKVIDMSNANWNDIISWTNLGVSNNRNAFIMKTESTFIGENWLPDAVFGFWYFPSDRLIQDINPGDERLDRYFTNTRSGFPFPNPRGRGIHYGASYFWKDSQIASTNLGQVTMFYAGSYEENQLLLAEAKVHTGDIEGGLGHLDAVRNFQNSGLPATVGTMLTEEQALEEIRKERRLALIMRSVSFYDARRYGVAAGSRTGARVLDTDGNLNTNATINYGYLEYWPVPTFESDFNSTSPTPL
ncbi:RagB/SusD family nutrient uptake outer membrane protein [Tenacibaculum agarivorans]|uniref:RagB/SusD family nutrient uptake outer membrane protein n=1 Tax=Tenacibaculum agarivorans TaxID=1908389 RepID=UPI00094B9C46|nr:RagB/SusD family nutrient uptake outer membrane protein [Tenacibaculum agarivorans]